MKTLRFKITGQADLIMHNGQLVDPLCKWTKQIKKISSKRNKSEKDHEEMGRLEFMGGLYLNENGPCIPDYVLEGMLIGKGGAARKHKMGKEAAAGLYCPGSFDLEYDGPRDAKSLWKQGYWRRDKVKVGMASVMRTRATFKNWSAIVEVVYDPETLNHDHIVQWMELAGLRVGLMDNRPRFGRFEVESVEK